MTHPATVLYLEGKQALGDGRSMTDTSQTALALREGLRRLAKAVVVITCQHGGERFAMTATAVSELSMDPPSLLICVNRSASLHAPLSAKAACLSVLDRPKPPWTWHASPA